MRPIDGDDLTTRIKNRADVEFVPCLTIEEITDEIAFAPVLDIDDKRAFDAGYQAGKRDEMRWIPVGERVPQDEQWVAALLYGLVGYNTILLQYNAMLNEFITDDGIEYDIDDVAYWVGLPEPPEEPKGEQDGSDK